MRDVTPVLDARSMPDPHPLEAGGRTRAQGAGSAGILSQRAVGPLEPARMSRPTQEGERSMRTSRYNLMVDLKDGGAVLYNCLRGSLTSWEAEEVPDLRDLLARPEPVASSLIWPVLIEQGNVIPDDVDELEIVRQRRRAGVTDPNRLDVIVLPTLQCNFACGYCYETPRGSAMTEETERHLTAWLDTSIPQYRLVLLHWFGGEPLLCSDTVARVTERAREAASRAGTGVIVSPHVTTNGHLLDAALARRLVDVGLFDYQITIDGPPDVHDAARPMRGGGPTFDRVFTNMVGALRCDERVTVSMRTNFNHTNIDRIPELLEMVPEDLRPRVRVVFEPVFGDCSVNAADNLIADDIATTLERYREVARKSGYNVSGAVAALETGKLVYCYAEREHQVVIAANGDVFKCSVCNFEPAERVGRLVAGGRIERDEEQWARWVNPDQIEEKCLDCIYLPLCMGGCRKTRLAPATGATCSLVASNASYVLKTIALGGVEALVYAAGEGPDRLD
jgi:uncharacterized protein